MPNEGYTEPADTLIWCFSFLFFLKETIAREQLVLGIQPTPSLSEIK